MDESALLKKIESFVNNTKADEKDGKTSWWTGLVLFFVVLIAIVAFAWIYSRQSAELAKLQHEKNKREIEEGNKLVQQAAEQNDAKRQAISNEIAALREQKSVIDKKIEDVKAARQADKARIDSINSWSDI